MEHYPNSQPMDHKKWIGFDDFEAQIDEALEENDTAMSNLFPIRRPGEIGGVACRPTLLDLPDPPEAA